MPDVISSRTCVRVGATALALATLTLAGGTAAQAHVRVIPESTAAGSFTKLTFRVPTESDTASTVSLAITLPADTPLAFVSAQQLDGWTVKVVKAKLAKPVEMEGTTITEAPSTVTWTATKGHEVGPGQFQEFSLSGGPLPAGAKSIAFPAVQTYSDGTVAKWDQPQPAGGEEPEHPVPSFDLTAAVAEDGHATPAPAGHTEAVSAVVGDSSEAESDTGAMVLGGAGLVAGLLGLAFGVLAWRKAGSRDAAA